MNADEIVEKALYPTAAAIFESIPSVPGVGARACEHAAVAALRAALPIIREELAQQVESISTHEPGDGKRRSASMRTAAARIVRGDPA